MREFSYQLANLIRVPSFWVREKEHVNPSFFSAVLKAVMVFLANGFRDSFKIAAFSLSSNPNIPS